LVVLARWLEVGRIVSRPAQMEPTWVGLLLALSVVQVAASGETHGSLFSQGWRFSYSS